MDINMYGQGGSYAYSPVSNFTPYNKVDGDNQKIETGGTEKRDALPDEKDKLNQGVGQEQKDDAKKTDDKKSENDPRTFYERELEKQKQMKEKRLEEKKEEERKEELKEQKQEEAKKQEEERKKMMEQQLGSLFQVESAGAVEALKGRLGQQGDQSFQLNNSVIPNTSQIGVTL